MENEKQNLSTNTKNPIGFDSCSIVRVIYYIINHKQYSAKIHIEQTKKKFFFFLFWLIPHLYNLHNVFH